jgi:hypothetical protein
VLVGQELAKRECSGVLRASSCTRARVASRLSPRCFLALGLSTPIPHTFATKRWLDLNSAVVTKLWRVRSEDLVHKRTRDDCEASRSVREVRFFTLPPRERCAHARIHEASLNGLRYTCAAIGERTHHDVVNIGESLAESRTISIVPRDIERFPIRSLSDLRPSLSERASKSANGARFSRKKSPSRERLKSLPVAATRLRVYRHVTERKAVRLTPYVLRHSHISALLAAGVPVRTVADRVGHANATMTLNVYAHVGEDDRAGVVEIVERLTAGIQ